MSGTESVRVTVTSVTGDDTLVFSGSGALSRDSRGTHLRYTARDDTGNEIPPAPPPPGSRQREVRWS